jgi:hypothetical protein
MNEQTDQLGRAEEEILAHTVSDEALEAAAAGTERGAAYTWIRTAPGLSAADQQNHWHSAGVPAAATWRARSDRRCC